MNKLLALFTAIIIALAPISLLGFNEKSSISKLSGRDDFALGVNIHQAHSYAAYVKSYNTILDAKATGAKFLRTGYDGDEYTLGFVDLAAKHGLGVMINMGFSYYNSSTKTPISPDQIDIEGIYDAMYSRALNLKGKVAFYQINNEMCIPMLKGGNGMNASQFKDCSGIAVGLYASVKAIRKADPNAKIVVNFSWEHIGIMDAIKAVKIDADTGRVATSSSKNITHASWDLIGMDWYSNGRNKDFLRPDGTPIDYDYIIETLCERHPEMDVIVCEANLWPTSENADGSINYSGYSQWLEDYIRYCYNHPRVKGFFVYELYDQPAYSKDSNGKYVFNKESHFGIIDKNGNKKANYETVRALYGGSGVVEERIIPQAPAINNEGKLTNILYNENSQSGYGTIPTVYLDRDFVSISKLSKINNFEGNFIEFDLYIEDLEAFKVAFNRNNLRIRAYLTSTNGGSRWSSYITDEDILTDGWNHITVPLSAFFDGTGNFEWGNINTFSLRFVSGKAGNYSEIAGMNIAVANICYTNILPNKNIVDDTKLVIDETGISNSAERYYQWYLENNRKTISVKNISAYERLEFDFYVENFTTFTNMTNENKLYLTIQSSSSGNSYSYEIAKYVINQGWNHIAVKIDEFDLKSGTFNKANFIKYGLHFANNKDSNGNNIANPYAATHISIRNFNALGSEINYKPEIPKNSIAIISENGISDSWGKYYNYTQDRLYIKLSDPVNLSNAENVEFDIYIDDLSDFKTMVANSSRPLYFILGTDEAKNKRRARYVFTDQVTENGWNHIVLDINDYSYGGGDSKPNFENVYWAYLSFWDEKSANENAKTITKIANICGTISMEIPDDIMMEKVDFIGPTFNEIKLDSEGFYTYDILKTDISNTKMLEIDIFIKDTNDAVFDIWLADFFGGYALYKFENLKVGWNHLAVRLNDFYDGEIDFSQITNFAFYFNNSENIIVSNFYAADYIECDANRDGKIDLKDVVRTKKICADITNRGNILAVSGTDYEIDAVDLNFLSQKVIENLFK